jgi:hypothetical protein
MEMLQSGLAARDLPTRPRLWKVFVASSLLLVLYVLLFNTVVLGSGPSMDTGGYALHAFDAAGLLAASAVQPLALLVRTLLLALVLQLFSVAASESIRFRDAFAAALFGSLVGALQLLATLAFVAGRHSIDLMAHPPGSLAALLPDAASSPLWGGVLRQLSVFEVLWCAVVARTLHARTTLGPNSLAWVVGGTWLLVFLAHCAVGLIPQLLGLPTQVHP